MTLDAIARVFPRRTKATPIDEYAFIGLPPLFVPEVEEVHISVSFTWDLPYAYSLIPFWERIAPVKIGGAAFNQEEGDFIPGRYLREGYVITSRGCPNRCRFCKAWRPYSGKVKELPIMDGWIVQDDNLLACSDMHIRKVFTMLKRQPKRAVFSGGLEASRLRSWHIEEFVKLKPAQLFFAYDTPDDLKPLKEAGKKLNQAGFNLKNRKLYCYVLIGYPKDTFEDAERRCQQTFAAGFIPFAMLYRNEEGKTDRIWRKFQREWARPAIIMARDYP